LRQSQASSRHTNHHNRAILPGSHHRAIDRQPSLTLPGPGRSSLVLSAPCASQLPKDHPGLGSGHCAPATITPSACILSLTSIARHCLLLVTRNRVPHTSPHVHHCWCCAHLPLRAFPIIEPCCNTRPRAAEAVSSRPSWLRQTLSHRPREGRGKQRRSAAVSRSRKRLDEVVSQPSTKPLTP